MLFSRDYFIYLWCSRLGTGHCFYIKPMCQIWSKQKIPQTFSCPCATGLVIIKYLFQIIIFYECWQCQQTATWKITVEQREAFIWNNTWDWRCCLAWLRPSEIISETIIPRIEDVGWLDWGCVWSQWMDKGKQKTLYSHLAGLYGVNELKILFLSLCC